MISLKILIHKKKNLKDKSFKIKQKKNKYLNLILKKIKIILLNIIKIDNFSKKILIFYIIRVTNNSSGTNSNK